MRIIYYTAFFAMLAGTILLSHLYIEAVGLERAVLWFAFWISGFGIGFGFGNFARRPK